MLRAGGWYDSDEDDFLEYCCALRELPAQEERLTDLRELVLYNCSGLTELPAGLGPLTRLEQLHVIACSGLTPLPHEIGGRTRLRELFYLPSAPGAVLSTQCSRLTLTALPDNLKVKALSGLKKLILPGCPGLTALPAGLGALMRLEDLLLSYCPAQHTPPPRVVGVAHLRARAGLPARPARLIDECGRHSVPQGRCEGEAQTEPEREAPGRSRNSAAQGIVHTCHQLSIRQSDTGPFAYDTSPGVIAFCEVCPIYTLVEWLIFHKDKNPLSPHNRLPRCLQM